MNDRLERRERNCSDLAHEFGVTAARVYQRAREEGWQEHRAEHESGKLPENKYACLVRASNLLDERMAALLREGDKFTVKDCADMSRALKTALEVKTVLSDKVDGPTQITVRFEHPSWAE